MKPVTDNMPVLYVRGFDGFPVSFLYLVLNRCPSVLRSWLASSCVGFCVKVAGSTLVALSSCTQTFGSTRLTQILFESSLLFVAESVCVDTTDKIVSVNAAQVIVNFSFCARLPVAQVFASNETFGKFVAGFFDESSSRASCTFEDEWSGFVICEVVGFVAFVVAVYATPGLINFRPGPTSLAAGMPILFGPMSPTISFCVE